MGMPAKPDVSAVPATDGLLATAFATCSEAEAGATARGGMSDVGMIARRSMMDEVRDCEEPVGD